MSSRELGLVLAQQLLDMDDLHYGLWGDDLPLTFSNLAEAQQRYSNLILVALPSPEDGGRKVLDIGCGTGHLLTQLLARGYAADGLVPASKLAEQVRRRLAEQAGPADLTDHGSKPARLFESAFEQFPVQDYPGYYDAALFSESFQYIPMSASLSILAQIVRPGGQVVICDFFQTKHAGDGGPGDRSFGGGHRMQAFYTELERYPFTLLQDVDITCQVSPNIRLLDETLMHKLLPAGQTLNRYLSTNYATSWGIIRALFRAVFRKKLEKQKYKYFSGHRTQVVFERYKTYRLLVLKRETSS